MRPNCSILTSPLSVLFRHLRVLNYRKERSCVRRTRLLSRVGGCFSNILGIGVPCAMFVLFIIQLGRFLNGEDVSIK